MKCAMKNIIIFILCLISFVVNSQTQEATLHFYDGASIEGYGLIFQKYKIKFRASLEDEPDVWDGTIVSGITFHGFEYDVEFGYVYAKNHERYPLLLEILAEGEVTLYVNVARESYFIPSFEEKIPAVGIHLNGTKYYVKRKDEDLATKLKGRFKKCIIEYFGECSGIIKRIDNHEFRWATMIDLVNYYNDFCTEE